MSCPDFCHGWLATGHFPARPAAGLGSPPARLVCIPLKTTALERPPVKSDPAICPWHGNCGQRHEMLKAAIGRYAIAIAWLTLLVPAWGAGNPAEHAYRSDIRRAVKIGNDLYQTLDERFQKRINPQAVFTEQVDAPQITPIQQHEESKLLCQVLISTGFVDLINHIAHAKAIDRIQPGYFRQYVSILARGSAGDNPPDPPNLMDARYWSDAVMNDQAGFFNQMVGITLSINLSHHYLGHYQKYAGQMRGATLAPINNFIAPAEWEASVKAATLNSLDCALGTEGAEALFEAIDQMPRRPAWTAYIVPRNVNIKKLNKRLAMYEAAYFHGGLKVDKAMAALTETPGGLAAN
jgi:hypothetical protein